MKKLVIGAFLLFGFASNLQAQQISKNALGVRLGDNDGFGGEISYQRGLSQNNRLELDLGLRSSNDVDSFKLVGLYQWVWNIDKGFNWYAGLGAGIGTWNFDKGGVSDNGIILLAAADLGVEYNFSIPLQISLDFRPELYFNSDDYRKDNFGPDFALSLRYKW